MQKIAPETFGCGINRLILGESASVKFTVTIGHARLGRLRHRLALLGKDSGPAWTCMTSSFTTSVRRVSMKLSESSRGGSACRQPFVCS